MNIIVRYMWLSLKKNFVYKANGIFVLIDTLMDCFSLWLFWVSLLALDLQLIGWTEQSLLLFMGYSLMSSAISNLFVGVWDIQDHVAEGTLDSYLVKPCNSILLILLERANFLRVGVTFPVGFVMVLLHVGTGRLGYALMGTVLCIIATILTEFILLGIYELCFWLKKTDSYADLLNTVFSIKQYPLIFFGKKIVMLFTYIVPVAFMGTLPVELITDGTLNGNLVLFLVLGIAIVGIVWLIWKLGRRRYESAN